MMNHKTLSKLHQKKYRNQYNLFLVEGKKSVEEAITAKDNIEQICVSKRFANEQKNFLGNLGTKEFRDRSLTILDDYALSQLSSTKTPSGIIAVVKKPETNLKSFSNEQIVPVFEDIRDPGNMGTMFRTAEWFGIKTIILIGGADPFQHKVVQASMGSIFSLNLIQVSSPHEIVEVLKSRGFKLVVTRPEDSKNFENKNADHKKIRKLAIVFGNESRGTSNFIDKSADEFWSLPSYGSSESLNVAVSFGICLYEFKK